jgi:peroxisomal 3,2-trans-enoyl-CoA isomerase
MFQTFEHIVYRPGPITEIRINRPKSLNSLTPDVYKELAIAFLSASQDNSAIFVLFTGEGRFFSSGADVKANSGVAFPELQGNKVALHIAHAVKDGLVLELQRIMLDLSKILVIAWNGPAIGVAAAWLGYADILLASPSAYLQTPFSELGLIPESGAAVMFRENMGLRIANEVLVGIIERILSSSLFSLTIMLGADPRPQNGLHRPPPPRLRQPSLPRSHIPR